MFYFLVFNYFMNEKIIIKVVKFYLDLRSLYENLWLTTII
jgi:hypothetical protein